MNTGIAPDKEVTSSLILGATGIYVIDELDLGPIKVKLMRPDGENWSLEQVSEVEKWYKRFLCLSRKHPTVSIVPTKPIDIFWHYHILDTLKYSEDCQNIFGYFLHHFPYFGMRGDEDAKNFEQAFNHTKELFSREFTESLDNLRKFFASSDAKESSDCEGTECGGTSCGKNNCDGKITSDFTSRPIFLH